MEKLTVKYGNENITLKDLAREVGLSWRTLYKHYYRAKGIRDFTGFTKKRVLLLYKGKTYTVPELAGLLNVAESTIYKCHTDGRKDFTDYRKGKRNM
jgi:transposase